MGICYAGRVKGRADERASLLDNQVSPKGSQRSSRTGKMWEGSSSGLLCQKGGGGKRGFRARGQAEELFEGMLPGKVMEPKGSAVSQESMIEKMPGERKGGVGGGMRGA